MAETDLNLINIRTYLKCAQDTLDRLYKEAERLENYIQLLADQVDIREAVENQTKESVQ